MNDIGRMMKVLNETKPGAATTLFRECLCSKLIPSAGNYVRGYSGIVNYDEILCPDCRREFSGHARVVCLRCKSLQGFMSPYRDKVTGFEMRGGQHYHIDGCPKCINGVAATPILEHVRHCRARGLVIRQDLDILQEIEQKSLQGQREVDKLRAELKTFGNQ